MKSHLFLKCLFNNVIELSIEINVWSNKIKKILDKITKLEQNSFSVCKYHR